ncbi:hypothetical protein M514_04538 [Trichuris suis]|uniref:Amino acid transporter transmembrane domain-containing protein n=1 Tax=Trichuris suis TaxID=68888 RepID=A0A085NIG1_9BILA|nr:hypothetical protein M513_04538 [Trichuris suis]KFD69257.1 hypothetical protein M514_04538 [Trichuris suis]
MESTIRYQSEQPSSTLGSYAQDQLEWSDEEWSKQYEEASQADFENVEGYEQFAQLESPDSAAWREELSSPVKIGTLQAGWNVTNAIQGMFIVSLPYTVLHGGWWSIFALVWVAFICYYTGVILVECLYDDQGKRIRGSYKAVAEACWGKIWGGRLVFTAQITELLMTCILYVVLCGDLMENSFPDSSMDKMAWMMLSAAALLPCAFIKDLRSVSWLSFWNAVTHVLINLIVIVYCFVRISKWELSSVSFSVNMRSFPTVLGIIVFSYTSHIFLPSLEGSMENQRKFKRMLKWSHVAAALFKSLFALFGFLTFGALTEEEISNNLPSQKFKAIVNITLVIKALLSYPLPYFTTVELMSNLLFRGKSAGCRFPVCFWSDGSLKDWALGVRICLVLFTLFMAISIPHFALLMGLVGSITGTMLSFIWPCTFYLHLKRGLSKFATGFSISIITTGALFGLIGIYYSSAELYRAVYMVDEYS